MNNKKKTRNDFKQMYSFQRTKKKSPNYFSKTLSQIQKENSTKQVTKKSTHNLEQFFKQFK